MRRTGQTVWVLMGAVALAACGRLDLLLGSDPAGSNRANCPRTAAVATIEVTPSLASIPVGSTMILTAVPKNISGSLVSATVGWNSSNFSAVNVESFDNARAGLARGLNVGAADITACHGDVVSLPAKISVTPGAPATLNITVIPSQATIKVGTTQQFTAVTVDERGSSVSGVPLVWSTFHFQIAFVNSTGLVSGLSPGQTRVQAASGGFTSTPAFLTVE